MFVNKLIALLLLTDQQNTWNDMMTCSAYTNLLYKMKAENKKS